MFTDISTLAEGPNNLADVIPAGDDLLLFSVDASTSVGQMWLEYSIFNTAKTSLRRGRVMLSYSAAVPTGDIPKDEPFVDEIGDTSDITFHATIDGGNIVEVKFSNADAADWYVAYELNQADQ